MCIRDSARLVELKKKKAIEHKNVEILKLSSSGLVMRTFYFLYDEMLPLAQRSLADLGRLNIGDEPAASELDKVADVLQQTSAYMALTVYHALFRGGVAVRACTFLNIDKVAVASGRQGVTDASADVPAGPSAGRQDAHDGADDDGDAVAPAPGVRLPQVAAANVVYLRLTNKQSLRHDSAGDGARILFPVPDSAHSLLEQFMKKLDVVHKRFNVQDAQHGRLFVAYRVHADKKVHAQGADGPVQYHLLSLGRGLEPAQRALLGAYR